MRLTKREKIMVIVLLFFVAEYFLVTYLITPQLAQLSAVETNIADWESKRRSLVGIETTFDQIDRQEEDIASQIDTIGKQYFASLDEQEETILVINDLLQNAGLDDISIDFDALHTVDLSQDPSDSATAADANMGAPLVQGVHIIFSGSYEALWSALRSFWNFSKSIEVDSVVINLDEDDPTMLVGTIELSLYDISPMTQAHKTLVDWGENGTFRKANPFDTASDETFPGTRYVLKTDDDDTDPYVKFNDISGHWAETAIDDFGRQHLVTGDSENRFRPDDPMTRGELVVLLDQFFHWEAPTDAVDLTPFSDYSELGQSQSAMEKAFYRGYLMGCLVGYDDGTLRPNAPTSYHEFELVMQRSLNQPDFKWKDAALTIEQETGFTSPGIDDESAYITRAEIVYYLHSLPQS